MRNRHRDLLDIMRVRGGVTVEELARALKVTRATIVNRLNSLLGEGLVVRTGLRPGARRPSVVYELSPDADHMFPDRYEEFLVDALGELVLRREASIKQVTAAIRERWLARDLPAVKGSRGADRVNRAVDVLARRGFMPALESRERVRVLRTYNCPLRGACGGFPDVRDAIAGWIEKLFGLRVTRLGCIATGHGSCTYSFGSATRPPPARLVSASGRSSRRTRSR